MDLLKLSTRLIDQIHDSVVSTDLDGRVTSWNKGAERLFGYTAVEMLGRHISVVYPVEEHAFLEQQVIAPLKRNGEHGVEVRMRRKSGEDFHAHLSLSLLYGERGEPVGMIGYSMDITDRKRAEAARRDSEERFRSLVEVTSDWIWEVNEHAVYTYASPKLRDLLGYAPHEVLGKTPFDLMPPEEAARVGALFGDIVRKYKPFDRLENVNRHRDGRLVVLETSGVPIFDAQGAFRGYRGVDRDITERKRAEQQLKELNETLEQRIAERSRELELEKNFIDTVLQTQSALVIVLDPHARIVRFNRACEATTGYAFDEVRDRRVWEVVIPPEQRTEVESTFTARLAGQAPRQHEHHWLTKSGGRRLIAWSSSAILNEAGQVQYAVITGIDVTERRAAEEALREAKELAESASRAKTEFLSRMSHELRTPLNAILGFAQLMSTFDQDTLTPAHHENLGYIMTAGWHLLELINEVLELSRIEAGRLKLESRTVELPEVAAECVQLITPAAEGRAIQIINSLSLGAPLPVQADLTRLKQVLMNLLSNAVKYNREGGRVTLSTVASAAGRVRVNVTDTGHGIAPEQQGLLFQPFERLGAERSGVEGTGIGLAISRRFVNLMGGSIGVDSTPGQGSTFWFELPAAGSRAS
jgi:PAS domain S-box-containing protein